MNRQYNKKRIDVSVVIPAHNEEENVGPLLDQFAQLIRRSRFSLEVIVVDDGSTDRTLPRLVDAQRNHRFVRIVSIPRRRGLTEALQAGFNVARGGILVFYPADRQFHPNDIPRMVEKVRQGYDLVTGRKIGQYNKRVVSGVYNRVSRWLFPSIPVTDLNSVKAFRRELAAVFDYRHDWHRFWVAIAAEAGYRVGEVDVTLYKRQAGRSKFGLLRIPGGVLDLLAVKFQYHTMRRPLWYFGLTGSILLVVAFLIGLWALYARFVRGHGFRPLLYLVMTLGLSGIVFFTLGFLAEAVAGLRQQLSAMQGPRHYSLYNPPPTAEANGERPRANSRGGQSSARDNHATPSGDTHPRPNSSGRRHGQPERPRRYRGRRQPGGSGETGQESQTAEHDQHTVGSISPKPVIPEVETTASTIAAQEVEPRPREAAIDPPVTESSAPGPFAGSPQTGEPSDTTDSRPVTEPPIPPGGETASSLQKPQAQPPAPDTPGSGGGKAFYGRRNRH